MQSLELVRHDKVPAVRTACQAALAAVGALGPQPAAAAAERPRTAMLTHGDGASVSARPSTAVRDPQPSGRRYTQEPGNLHITGEGDESSGPGPRGMQGASGVAVRGQEAQGADRFGVAVEQEAGRETDRSWEVGPRRLPSEGGGRAPGGQRHGPVREAWLDAGARSSGQVEAARAGPQQQQREQAWARSSLPRQQRDPEGAADDEGGAEDMLGDAEPEAHTLRREEGRQQWQGQGNGASGEELIDQDLRLSREHVDFLQQQAEQLMGAGAGWVHAEEDREEGEGDKAPVSAHSERSRGQQQHQCEMRQVRPGLHRDWAGSGQAASGARQPAPAPMVVRPLPQPRSAGRPGRYGGADVSREAETRPRRSVEQGSYAAAYAKGLQDGQDMARTSYYDEGKRVEKCVVVLQQGSVGRV